MKKKNYRVLFSILTLAAILFSSCGGGGGGGGIFSAIESEVKLGKKTAPWAIRSLVYYNGSLYCTNGNKIFKKSLSAKREAWITLTTQFDGAIGLLASDDSNLYVLTFKPSTEVTASNQESYNYSDVKVSVLYGSTGTVSLSNVRTIFDNKAISGREAFATVNGGATYKLNGSGAPTSTGQADIASAVKVNGSTQYHRTFLSTSNYDNTKSWYIPLDGNGSSLITAENNALFEIRGSNTIDLSKSLSEQKNGKLTGLAYYEEKNDSGQLEGYLLISTSSSGYHRVSLNGTNVVKSNPHKNAEQLAGMGIIEGSFWTFSNGAIYAGVTSADQSRYGLWSYYKGETTGDVWNLD